MKSISLFDTKNRLSEVCETVATTGEPVIITRRGKGLVQIIPLNYWTTRDSVWGTVEESRAKYGQLVDEFDLPDRTVASNRPDPLD